MSELNSDATVASEITVRINSATTKVMCMTLIRKEVNRFMRIWKQTFFPPIITTSLYFVIFGSLIGKRIGEMEGFSYMDFVVPGLVLMAIINNSYSNVVSSFFSAKFQNFIEELLVSPMQNWSIVLGYVTGGIIRGLLIGFVVTIIGLLFSHIQIYSYTIVISIAVLTSILFSLAGLIHGFFAKTFDDVSFVPTFILTPLIYLGGVFYSINLLPEFWQKVSLLNPVMYMINAIRFGFLGISDISIGISYTMIISGIILLAFWAMHLINKGFGIRT